MSSDMSPPPPPPPPASFSWPEALPPSGLGAAEPARFSKAAVASLILGLASLVCSCGTTLPALICGLVGLSAIGRSHGHLKGRGAAIGGMLLSLMLPVIGAGLWYATVGRQMQNDPRWQEVFGAGKSLMVGSIQGTEISATLKAHADTHRGRLPDSLGQLVESGALSAESLTHPADGSPGFWVLTQPGAVWSQLPAGTVIARGGPVIVRGEAMEVVILTDGSVKPQAVAAHNEDVDGGAAKSQPDASAVESDPPSPDAPSGP